MTPDDKTALRRAARAIRKRLALAAPDAALRLAAFADDLPDAAAMALYIPHGSEIDVGPLAQRLARSGHELCLPVTTGPDAPLVFRRWTPGDALQPDFAGMAAPSPDAAEIDPDLIVAPLLAFDPFGGRLGQGGGHYDRTFAALADAMRIGAAYSGQAVERVPMQAHDIPLHGVLTEIGYTPARKG